MRKKAREINTRIRDYQPEDFASLIELWQETNLAQPERGDQQCNDKGGRLLLMEETEKETIIGSSWMTWDGRRIYLHHFGILPSYQGLGLGTELAEKSLEWIREKGQQVKLEVHKENHAAKRLYEKLGFFAFRDYDIYMIRDLKS